MLSKKKYFFISTFLTLIAVVNVAYAAFASYWNDARIFNSIIPVSTVINTVSVDCLESSDNNCQSFGSPVGNSLSYTDNGNGTITDNVTGLMWDQNGNRGGAKNQSDAWIYCNNLVLAGYSDWHLPFFRELLSLTDTARNPCIDPVFTNTQSDDYWTFSRSDASGGSSYYSVDFGNCTNYVRNVYNEIYLRCVR